MLRKMRTMRLPLGVLAALVLLPTVAFAAEGDIAEKLAAVENTLAEQQITMDTLWVMIAGFLVFFMNAGFALVESGFARSKNTVNILAKNFIVFAIGSMAFWLVGFAVMFGDGNDWFGSQGLALLGADNSPALGGDGYEGVYGSIAWSTVPLYAKFFFQLVFAVTAATIVSGAVAERIHFPAYMVFAFVLVAVMYPVTGHWIWGEGWLQDRGFHDFAGSTVVHSVGGWAALVGAFLLGPRLGKYRKDGSVHPLPGHNMALATLGGLILWLGWFGFNPGSTMAANGGEISHVATITAMAAAAGVLGATLTARLKLGGYDLSMIINGSLAGLVAITAPCYAVGITSAVIIGFIAGIVVVFSVMFFDRIKIDDPVGATSVHLVCGIWGTLAVGLFASPGAPAGMSGLFFGGGAGQLVTQAIGVVAVGVFTVVVSFIVWYAIKLTIGLRVTPEQEYMGLDLSEMGMEAYPSDAAAGSPGTGPGGTVARETLSAPALGATQEA